MNAGMQAAASRRDRFERDGFLVLPGFVSTHAIAELRVRAGEIVAAFDPQAAAPIFSTRDAVPSTSEAYFLESAMRVSCFFEEEAFDARGALRQEKALSINKIGHALHDLDDVFSRFSHTPELAALAADLGNDDPRIYQSMYIFKQPHIGGEVRWHQDVTYFWTDPITVTTLWFALEHADRTNGCLWVERGGHRSPLRERFAVNGGHGALEPLDATPWPDEAHAEPVEVEAGTLVVLHGALPHYSAPNRSDASRHAFLLHFLDGRVPYATTNWLQRPAESPARGFR